MIKQLRKRIEDLPAFTELIASGSRETTVTGLGGSLGAFVVAGLHDSLQRQIVVLASSEESSERMRDDLALLLGADAVRLFKGSVAPGGGRSGSGDVADIQAILSLKASSTSVIVASPRGAVRRLPSPARLDAHFVELTTGGVTDFEGLVHRLRGFGFEQKDFVEVHGDFALRGGILDIYTFAGDNPVRAEFVGNVTESLREFDPLSQRSIRELHQAMIIPNLLGRPDGADPAPHNASLLEFAAPDALLFVEEPDAIKVAIESKTGGEEEETLTFADLDELFSLFPRISVRSFARGGSGVLDFGARQQPSFNGSIAMLRRDLAGLQGEGFDLTVMCDTQSELVRLKDLLGTLRESTRDDEETDEPPIDIGSLRLSLEAIHGGFLIPEARIALYTEHEVFNRVKRRGRARPAKFRGLSDREMQKLGRGDFVVHQDFGIGRFDGMKRIRVGGAEQEVVKILYDAHDTLFVNLNYVSKLQKYSSKEGHVPVLSRLGSAEWEKLKSRTKKRVKDIARDLITLYARRRRSEGFAFSPDTPWQKELEASFMYEDTFDQAKATLDVKKDMEAAHPMDRLICGDVGFGKTEVAVRAAFKAVLDGKQVAVLVPTTILAMQHFNTFNDRLSRYGVRLDVISRFRSTKDQAAIVAGLREGGVDIVIGTHRILSKDVGFKDLGLLVIDEEHRFGVAAKEKLRYLRSNVDTLSLTATPIPRTLHFSLMGARDLSIIATPPRNRLPILTSILQWNDDVIREAVTKELGRGGQIYFVHDRVQTMDDITHRLRELLPTVRLRAAHGQMTARSLEDVMMMFMEKKCDVLVATKIIESGLDIPNVNTIIINRADRFGMAELYQLRGRVGRSNVQAHAYLLTPPVSALTPPTLRRLQALEEFTELGSGFNLSMRDLEIRGAGNLLGAEQSGFIETMGFETYTRILEEAVQELKQEEFQDLFEKEQRPTQRDTAVETDLDAFIPESYVSGDVERLALYRQLYALTTHEQLQEVREEMTDRFGRFPPEIEHLFGMVLLRLTASEIGLSKISLSENVMEADFPPESDTQFYESELFQQIMASITKLKSLGATLRQVGKVLRLHVRLGELAVPEEKLVKSIEILYKLVGKETQVTAST